MKQSAILLCVAAVLCVGCIVYAHAYLMATADEVAFRETVYAGDIAATEGLTLTTRQSVGRQIYWDSAMPVAAPGLARTGFTARTTKKAENPWFRPEGLVMYFALSGWGGGSYDYGSGAEVSSLDFGQFSNYGEEVYRKLILPAIERTPAGEKHVETIRLCEQLDHEPLLFYLDLGQRLDGFYNDEFIYFDNEAFVEWMNDYFRFPVPEDATITIKAAKNSKGQLMTLEIETHMDDVQADREPNYMERCSAVTEGKCWFAFSEGGSVPLDYSAVRGGRGLYCLPFTKRAEREAYGNEIADVEPEKLHVVLPLAEGEEPIELYDGGNGTLLLVLQTGEQMELVVLDTETEQVLQRLTMFDRAEMNEQSGVLTPLGEWLYAVCENRVCLYERGADGRYTLLLDAPNDVRGILPDEFYYAGMDGPSAVAWDGERLAAIIASTSGYRYDSYNTGGGLLLTVYDASGLRYCGKIQSGAMDGELGRYTMDAVLWNDYGVDDARQTGIALAFDNAWSAEAVAAHEGVSFSPAQERSSAAGAGIIGGADAATTILVAQEPLWGGALIVLIVVLLAVAVLILRMKKQKKKNKK